MIALTKVSQSGVGNRATLTHQVGLILPNQRYSRTSMQYIDIRPPSYFNVFNMVNTLRLSPFELFSRDMLPSPFFLHQHWTFDKVRT